MMIKILEYFDNWRNFPYWDLYKVHKAEDEESAFKMMYSLEKGSRYDNSRHYIFDGGATPKKLDYRDARGYEDPVLRGKYADFCKSYNTIEHFYGSVVYD